MDNTGKRERAYLVDGTAILHLQEADGEFRFKAFDVRTKSKTGEGGVLLDGAAGQSGRGFAALRKIAMKELGMDGGTAAPVSLLMLQDGFLESDIRRRKIFEPETLPQKDIRVIDSSYNEHFRIPDGGVLQVSYPDRKFAVKCRHIDEYHSYYGYDVFHICQFAEIVEKNGGSVEPEPESDALEAGWRLGSRRILAVQSSGDGWKFAVFDEKFRMTASGILDRPGLSINEARNEIMEAQGMDGLSMTEIGYAYITMKAQESSP